MAKYKRTQDQPEIGADAPVTRTGALGRLVDRQPSRASSDAGQDPDPRPRPDADAPPPRASMHSLTVETFRLLTEVGLNHVDDIKPETAQSLEYCLTRMKRYARDDWTLIRDLQPLLLALRRRNPTRPLTFP